MAELGTWVVERAEEMTCEMAMKDSVDSLPPVECSVYQAWQKMRWREKLTLENGGIAGLDCQTGNVGNDFWACLKDDEKDANWA